MDIGAYLQEVRSVYATGVASEHSYRPALHKLFNSVDAKLTAVNEPKKVEVGAPDFVFNRGEVPIGWAEAKDIDKNLAKLDGYSKEQKERYRKGLPNLIYTNGIDFEFFREGERINAVSIAEFAAGLPSKSDRFDELERNLESFAQQTPVSITSAAKLASFMAGKAAIIKDVLGNLLREDKEFRTPLAGQFQAFKADLLPDLASDEFADIYAETITYGMFAARLHDTSLGDFSRAEALILIPKSNPFLRKLFVYIAGPELDERIAWIVDDLAAILRASDPALLFQDFGKFTARNDPFIHFYEDFLREYNPAKRKSRGVWYTPEPVVDFIVRAVDDVLRSEFDLVDGLADTNKIVLDWDTGQRHPKTGKALKEKREVHRVQILDAATGTGTFLAKVIQTVADRVKVRASGKWHGYVEKELIPRLHGFELLMASYAMCHLKLEMMLKETAYEPGEKPPRLSVWLTNALEPGNVEQQPSFFTALTDESHGAGEVKRNYPIMCVIGNPPYSGESANTGAHISDLMNDYKKEPGGKQRLQERNFKWINDDYVKFIRFAEHTISANPGGGVVGFITNHGYLSNPTFRGMRWHLLKSFDDIYVIDLHGNSKRKERSPDGSSDVNVFDIQQGVAILVAVRRPGNKTTLGRALHASFWGTRSSKYEQLFSSDLSRVDWQVLDPRARYFMFYPVDHQLLDAYDAGFALDELFLKNEKGITTSRDHLAIGFDASELTATLNEFIDPIKDDDTVRTRFYGGKKPKDGKLPGDTDSWSLGQARRKLREVAYTEALKPLTYRPLDNRTVIYSDIMLERPRDDLMSHVIDRPNLSLSINRGFEEDRAFSDCLIVDRAIQIHSLSLKEANNLAPLYLYAAEGELGGSVRRLNFDRNIYSRICKRARLTPSSDIGPSDPFRRATGEERPTEVKVLDYIYGVLHSPAYRATYAEFLKIDFPRIPYPRDPETFRDVSEKGEQLRRLHLMEPQAIGDTPYPYNGSGDDVVASGYPKWENERVYINKDQYFEGVPKLAWEFYIGGYQPAQKWLKDRRGRTLSWQDVTHYQGIVKILLETNRIMKEIKLPLD